MSTIIQLLTSCRSVLAAQVTVRAENNISLTHKDRHFAKIDRIRNEQLIADIDFYLLNELEEYAGDIAVNPYSCHNRQPRPEDFELEEDYKARFKSWQDWETWKELNMK